MRKFVGMLLAAAGLALGMAAGATDTVAKPISIPAGDLHKALKTLARTTGAQLLYNQSQVDGLQTRGVKEAKNPAAAVAALLEGTALESRVDASGAILIVTASSVTSGLAPADQMRMAMTEAGAEPAAQDKGPQDAGQVVVQSQRERSAPFSTANLDLTRTEDDALPFTVFTAREIQQSGMASLQEFLQERLPQNFSLAVVEEGEGKGFDMLNGTVDMRGWGAGETVFLLNGRRMEAAPQYTNLDGANATPNLAAIPVASIERIEVLSSAGSAIYGAGATGGVINIITRRDFRGGQLSLNYETPTDTIAARRGMTASYGLPLKWGFGLRVQAGFTDSEPLSASQRSGVTIERWRQLARERDPAKLYTATGGNPYVTSITRYGATPNVRATTTSLTTGNLFSGMPGVTPSNFTTVPAGATGSAPRSAYTPGVYNLEIAEGAANGALYAANSTIGTVNTNKTLSLGLDRSFGPDWQWSLEYRYADHESQASQSGALQFASTSTMAGQSSHPRVPAGISINPFPIPVTVALVDPGLQRPELANRPGNTSWSANSTLRGRFGEWRGFLDVSYAHNSNVYQDNMFWEPIGGWLAAMTAGRYNPFVDPRVVSPGAEGFYDHYIARQYRYHNATRTYQTGIKASGPVFDLPAGAVQLTTGLDGTRVDRYRSDYYGEYRDNQSGALSVPFGAASAIVQPLENNPNRRFKFDSYALYGEVNIPVLSPAQSVPLMHQLELFGSARIDRAVREGFRSQTAAEQQAGVPPESVEYTDTARMKAFGLRYSIIEGLQLRATRSGGFRPPSVMYVTPEIPTVSQQIIDRIRDPDGVDPVTLTTSMYAYGGNPDLQPESTDSTNIGLIFRPRWLPGLRVSVDYLKSERENAIHQLAFAQAAVDLEADLPGRIHRGPPDGHPSGVGPITFVDHSYANLRLTRSESADFSVEQAWDNVGGGRIALSATASRNISFKVQSSANGPLVEQVRSVSGTFQARQIEWNGNAQIRWEGPRWGVGWSTRYLDYILVQPTYYALQGSDRIPWKLNHDLSISYRGPAIDNPHGAQWLLSGTSVNVGVRNVFGRIPRFNAASIDRGIGPGESMYGRTVWMRVSRDFR